MAWANGFDRHWIARLVGLVAVAGGMCALGLGAGSVAGMAILGAQFYALISAGAMPRLRSVNERRLQQQTDKSEARLREGLGRAHDWIYVASELEECRAAIQDEAAREAISETIAGIESLQNEMRIYAASGSRDAPRPTIGGHAAAIAESLGAPLKGFAAPRVRLPRMLSGVGGQIRAVVDEIRVLHDREIERSVLLFTVVARCVLVLLAPLLAPWTHASTPLGGTGSPGDIAWGLAVLVSIVTALGAPRLVDLAMTDSPGARMFRRALLIAEVPIAIAIFLAVPAWTVAVFAVGWTNWWQRQTAELAFDWGKLAAFGVLVVGLEGIGLHLQGIPANHALAEISLLVVAIFVTGASYGAMMFLTIGTMIAVVLGDGARSVRVSAQVRARLLACAADLQQTALVIEATAPDFPVAENASSLSRRAARRLEREADLVGRWGFHAPQTLGVLFDTAIGQSRLARADTPALEIARHAAKTAGRSAPPYAMEPNLGELRSARIDRQRHARALLEFSRTAYNEASVHGTKGVRTFVEREGGLIVVRIANLPSPAQGTAGEGGHRLRDWARRLADEPRTGLVAAKESGYPGSAEWWEVRLCFDQSLLRDS